jgi:hypothetical protein
MSVTNIRVRFGLSFNGTSSREGVVGSANIGLGNQDKRIANGTEGAVARLLIAPSTTVDWDILEHLVLTEDAWTAGNAQVESTTAAGTASATGNITVTVTSSGMSGSPLAITVPIASGDTATQWAAKVRSALQANDTIAARFTVGGSTTAISLTRKPLKTFIANGESVHFYAGNDSALNIAIAAGSTGVTTDSTSDNTTNGVATAGFKVYEEGVDYEGKAMPTMDRIYALDVRSNSGEVTVGDGGADGVNFVLKSGGRACFDDATITGLSFQAIADPVDVAFAIAGSVD